MEFDKQTNVCYTIGAEDVKSIFVCHRRPMYLPESTASSAMRQTPVSAWAFVVEKQGLANMDTKKCTKCGTIKPISEFYKNRSKPSGLACECKTCARAYANLRYANNQEKIAIIQKISRAKHQERITAYNKNYYAKHQERNIARARIYRSSRRKEMAAYTRAYYAEHKEEKRIYNKNYLLNNLESVAARKKIYRYKYKDKVAARQKAYRSVNKDKVAARQKAYYTEHKERIAARSKIYRAANLDKHRASQAKRKAIKINAPGNATAEQIAARWEVYGNKCYICGAPAEATDHVIPLDKGGSNWPANLRPICKRCNSTKGAKWPYDFKEAQAVGNRTG